MMKSHILALYNDMDEAALVLDELNETKLPGFSMKDVVIKSPIEHPELSEKLGKRPVYVQLFTLIGVLFGPITGLTLVASAQASFIYQVRGGRPVVPVPPDMVLTYEFFILSGVLMTVIGCFIGWKLPGNRSPLYNTRVSEDKIGILVKAETSAIPYINEIFKKHHSLEILGEDKK
ncbi:MAG: DUF3341 domain-containing protein [Betaproteobacteria bacterium]|nr:DUF3341 domain-containing protein [Betaproteobacteria bacterium]MDE2056267.1 DUF3341 domain-containing protein [Betaproteobacteria bacterium]